MKHKNVLVDFSPFDSKILESRKARCESIRKKIKDFYSLREHTSQHILNYQKEVKLMNRAMRGIHASIKIIQGKLMGIDDRIIKIEDDYENDGIDFAILKFDLKYQALIKEKEECLVKENEYHAKYLKFQSKKDEFYKEVKANMALHRRYKVSIIDQHRILQNVQTCIYIENVIQFGKNYVFEGEEKFKNAKLYCLIQTTIVNFKEEHYTKLKKEELILMPNQLGIDQWFIIKRSRNDAGVKDVVMCSDDTVIQLEKLLHHHKWEDYETNT